MSVLANSGRDSCPLETWSPKDGAHQLQAVNKPIGKVALFLIVRVQASASSALLLVLMGLVFAWTVYLGTLPPSPSTEACSTGPFIALSLFMPTARPCLAADSARTRTALT